MFYRSKTYMFEEFLFAWQERLRKLEQPTVMSVKLQGEVDKYKVKVTFEVMNISQPSFHVCSDGCSLQTKIQMFWTISRQFNAS